MDTTDTTETTIAQTPGSEEPECGIATPARGECVVLNLRHFEPILSTQVLVSSVVLPLYYTISGLHHH